MNNVCIQHDTRVMDHIQFFHLSKLTVQHSSINKVWCSISSHTTSNHTKKFHPEQYWKANMQWQSVHKVYHFSFFSVEALKKLDALGSWSLYFSTYKLQLYNKVKYYIKNYRSTRNNKVILATWISTIVPAFGLKYEN